jgi:drug/metabolite transporter (DMT)-like permease
MIFFYFLAILAAFCWAIASLISADVTRNIGGLVFNRLRLFFVSIMLIGYTTIINTWQTISLDYLNIILVSGIIGIFLGDTMLFMALQKIGPRRNNILFSLAAPFTVLLNISFLGKEMSLINLIGCFIVFIGVVIAIAYGSNNNNKNHRWEKIEGSLFIGVIFGILAALCQAIGLIMMKPVLDSGADPIASAALRASISCVFLAFTFFIKSKNFISKIPLNSSIIIKSIISGFLGMALGMSLLLVALQKADAGIVATLSSTSPIMILFFIWILTKKTPSLGAWFGTIVAILGTGLIFIY